MFNNSIYFFFLITKIPTQTNDPNPSSDVLSKLKTPGLGILTILFVVVLTIMLTVMIFNKGFLGTNLSISLAKKMVFEPSSGFTQGNINASKLYTCNITALVFGLQASSPIDGVVLAVVEDINLMATRKAVVTMTASRSELQKAPWETKQDFNCPNSCWRRSIHLQQNAGKH